MSDAATAARPLAGLAPPPVRRASIFKQLARSTENAFELLPLAMFEQPIYVQKSAFGRAVVVSDPEGVKRVLVDNVANYPKNPMSAGFFSAMFGDGLLSTDGELWRRHRKIMAPAFSPAAVAAYAPVIAGVTEDFVADWRDGQVVDIAEAMKQVTLKVICETMFSSDAPELTGLADTALGFSYDALKFGVLDIVPVIGPRRIAAKQGAMRSHFAGMDKAIYRMIAERQADLDKAPNDLLTRLIAARDPDGGEALSPKEIRDQVITIFEAGHETTAVALTFTFYLLSQFPEVEARLHAELGQVLGARAPAGEDVPNLPYTRQVIEESMRLYPPAPAVMTRVARAADVICGEQIRAGDPVAVMGWVIHRHRTLWEDPERFDPDRFSPERSRERPRYAYIPFGAGPHICIGAVMAMTEAVLMLAAVARKFRLRLAQDEVRLQQRITIAPLGGLKMRLEARN